MSFTQGIKIIDVMDDFINPSEECILPIKVEGLKKVTGPKIKLLNIEEKINKTIEKVSITLNDCLACSGCITSAETILINEQSNQEFFNQIKSIKNENINNLIVISLSPQSISSLSIRFNLGNLENARIKLTHFFKSLSIDCVLNTNFGREFSLIELSRDIYERLNLIDNKTIIASSCPGWVCYAEKHKENSLLIPLISKVKSPQQIMGVLVKKIIKEKFKKYKNNIIFHATVMPCYDKKLEASRNEFSFIDSNKNTIKEVDIVLSTIEIETMIIESKYDFNINNNIYINLNEIELAFKLENENCYDNGSGGYLEAVLRYCAKEMFNINLITNIFQDEHIKVKNIKGDNYREVILYSGDDSNLPLLTFAYAYGFRNIQNIVQSIRKGIYKYQFIEIMACPGGCINGGGQIKTEIPLDNIISDIYRTLSRNLFTYDLSVMKMYNEWKDRSELHTTYNIVKPLEIINPRSVKW